MRIVTYFLEIIKDKIVTILMVICMVYYISFMILGFSLNNEIWILITSIVVTFMAILSRILGDFGKLMTIGVSLLFLVMTYGVLLGYYGLGSLESFLAEFVVCIVGNLILYGAFLLYVPKEQRTIFYSGNAFINFINRKIVNYFIRLLAHGGLTAWLVLMVTSEYRADDASKDYLVFQISNYVLAFLQSVFFATLSTWRKK